MPVHAVAYYSDASGPLSEERLDALVDDAARFNGLTGVTGVLLFDGTRFLQYFEGPEDGVDAVHERVRQARSHHRIVALGEGCVARRCFPWWTMRWLGVEPDFMQSLLTADWQAFAPQEASTPPVESGMGRLLQFTAPHMPGSTRAEDAPTQR